MERRDDKTRIVNNQVPPPMPQGMPHSMNADGNDNGETRALMAAAALLLGGTVGAGGMMAATKIGQEMDELDEAVQRSEQAVEEVQEELEQAKTNLNDAQQEINQLSQAPRKVVVVEDHMPAGVKVHSFTHITGADGTEMDVAYVTRNGVRGYYVDIDHDGIADGFIPESAQSYDEIVNLKEYGENVQMEPMATRVGVEYVNYGMNQFGIDDSDVAVVDPVVQTNYDDFEGPDYTNDANVEGMTGNVTYASNLTTDPYTGTEEVETVGEGYNDYMPNEHYQNDDYLAQEEFVAEDESIIMPEEMDNSFLADNTMESPTYYDEGTIDDTLI